jgi:Lar family restriction alleviation protein
MIELKPCPFCGGTDLIHYGDYIDCRSCDASGPWSTDKATSSELWNKRAEGETPCQ